MTRQRGFALILVLWTLTLLSFLATVFGSNARTEVYLARNLVENAQAEALADGGVFYSVRGLNKEPGEGGFRVDGRVNVWPTEDGEVRFSIRDEGGKIDLNQASEDLIRALLVVLGVDPAKSAALAAAILDFRDEDADKRRTGAEARDYRGAGLEYGPKNRPFAVIDELVYVLGMTPDLYGKLAPLVTVRGLEERPFLKTAPLEVREALFALEHAPKKGSQARSKTGDTAGTGIEAQDTTSSARDRTGSGSSGLGSRGSSSGFGSSDGSGSLGGSGSSGSLGGSRFGSGGSGFGSGGSGFGSGSSFGSRTDDTGADEEIDILEGGDDPVEEATGERSDVLIFSVHAEGRTAAGTVFARDALIDFSGSEDLPFTILSWRQGERQLFPVEAATPVAAPPPG